MTMSRNPILDELHAVRERLLADAGGTLDALIDRLQANEQQSNRPRFKSRHTLQRAGTANSGELARDNQSATPGDQKR